MDRSWRREWLFLLVCLICLARPNVNAASTDNTVSSPGNPCLCHKSCLQSLAVRDAKIASLHPNAKVGFVSSQPSYVYDSKTSSCVELSTPCEASPSCVFESHENCQARCGVNKAGSDGDDESGKDQKSKGCEATELRCCSDGSPRSSKGICAEDVHKNANAALPPSNSQDFGVRWDLVATGMCVLVLLVAVLSVSGIMAYHYREKQRERIRSRYIHDVLEMYESGSESSASEGGSKALQPEDNAMDTHLFVKA